MHPDHKDPRELQAQRARPALRAQKARRVPLGHKEFKDRQVLQVRSVPPALLAQKGRRVQPERPVRKEYRALRGPLAQQDPQVPPAPWARRVLLV